MPRCGPGPSTVCKPASGWIDLVPQELVVAVLRHCDWTAVKRVLMLCKATHGVLAQDRTWRVLCHRFVGAGPTAPIYIPPVPLDGAWRATFVHVCVNRCDGDALPPAPDDPTGNAGRGTTAAAVVPNKHKITVTARVRPKQPPTADTDGEAVAARAVTVPLHQKLQMIRRAKQCSSSDARKLLWAANTGPAEDGATVAAAWDPWSTATAVAFTLRDPNTENAGPDDTADPPTASSGSSCPPTAAAAAAAATAVSSTSPAGIVAMREQQIVICAPGSGLREYELDEVLGHATTQGQVFEAAGRRVVTDFLNGVNGTVFMFGQTGSGKTYTMFGPDADASCSIEPSCQHGRGVAPGLHPQRGMLPRALAEVVGHVVAAPAAGRTATLKVAFVEVQGNEVANLLAPGEAVGAWHGVAARTVLDGLASVPVRSAAEAEALLRRGEQNKRRAATAMNARSTRAHAVLIADLVQTDPATGVTTASQLCLADLGGSEQLKKSKATGDRLTEAVKINQGLLALKQCIDALNGQRHVPYYASTLTSLLKGALGGNSRTSLVVTCSAAAEHATETMQALNFGLRCRRVENSATSLRMSGGTAAIDAINARLAELEVEIRNTERWENRLMTREDVDGPETYIESVLVGADDLRGAYEDLLATKRQLVGV